MRGRYSRHDGTISIHAPPRGATNGDFSFVFDITFQFTPLREGRRRNPPAASDLQKISIHAPPRGATAPSCHIWLMWLISIHAPPRGATLLPAPVRQRSEISIHAPPRGATKNRT